VNKTDSINHTKKVRPIKWTEDEDGRLWADFHWGSIVVRELKHPSEPRNAWLATLFDTKGDLTLSGEYRDHRWSCEIDAEYLYQSYVSINKKSSKEPRKPAMNLDQAVEWIALNDEPKDVSPSSISGYISVQLAADIFGVRPVHVARLVSAYRKRDLKK
jgi:hypothetical protein